MASLRTAIVLTACSLFMYSNLAIAAVPACSHKDTARHRQEFKKLYDTNHYESAFNYLNSYIMRCSATLDTVKLLWLQNDLLFTADKLKDVTQCSHILKDMEVPISETTTTENFKKAYANNKKICLDLKNPIMTSDAYIQFTLTRYSGVYGIVGTTPSSWRSFVPVCPPGTVNVGKFKPEKAGGNGAELPEIDSAANHFAYYQCYCRKHCKAPLTGVSITTPTGWGAGYNSKSTITCALKVSARLDKKYFKNGPPTIYGFASDNKTPILLGKPMYHYYNGGPGTDHPIPAQYGVIDSDKRIPLDYIQCWNPPSSPDQHPPT